MQPLMEIRDLSSVEADLEDRRVLIAVGQVIQDNPDLQKLLRTLYNANIEQLARLNPLQETDRSVAIAVATVHGKLEVARFLYSLGVDLTTHQQAYKEALERNPSE